MIPISGVVFPALCCIYCAAYCVNVFRGGNSKAGVIGLGVIALTVFVVARLMVL